MQYNFILIDHLRKLKDLLHSDVNVLHISTFNQEFFFFCGFFWTCFSRYYSKKLVWHQNKTLKHFFFWNYFFISLNTLWFRVLFFCSPSLVQLRLCLLWAAHTPFTPIWNVDPVAGVSWYWTRLSPLNGVRRGPAGHVFVCLRWVTAGGLDVCEWLRVTAARALGALWQISWACFRRTNLDLPAAVCQQWCSLAGPPAEHTHTRASACVCAHMNLSCVPVSSLVASSFN